VLNTLNSQALWRQLTWWVLLFPAALVLSMALDSLYLLFMGFILGPVLRSLQPQVRTAVIAYLTPRTMLYFPVVSLTAGTAGWALAARLGYNTPGSPFYFWAMLSLGLVLVMTVVGLCFLLPNALRIWRELGRPEPDREKIMRLNRYNIWLSGGQGVMQVAMILVMAHFRF